MVADTTAISSSPSQFQTAIAKMRIAAYWLNNFYAILGILIKKANFAFCGYERRREGSE
ncbi:MAG: hypothetical protein QNJ18_04645 [Xenococcaceae cyanobacterium MO_167.B52]|nr:hypothetical protein [Xenococcaceae cyanobacterium MO_167.B52]